MAQTSEDILQYNKENCTGSSNTSRAITYIQILFYSIFAIVVTVYSSLKFSHLLKQRKSDDKKDAKCLKKITTFFKLLWQMKSCYIPLVMHIIDQASDAGVIAQFGYFAQREAAGDIDCIGLSMNELFIASIVAFFGYRIVSSLLIGYATRSIVHGLIQAMDLQIFRAMYLNWKMKRDTPCNPQRWIQGLEAAYESSVQALIQIYYLIKTGTFSTFSLVLVSTISSLWSISSKLVSDDKIMMKEAAKHGIYQKEISKQYIVRLLFRVQDVTIKIFLYVLLWIVTSGFVIIGIMAFEFMVIMFYAIRLQQFDVLFGVISIVISKTNERSWSFTVRWTFYKIIWNIVMSVVMLSLLLADEYVGCGFCPPTEYYQVFIRDNVFSQFLVYYCLISSFITFPLITYYVFNQLIVNSASASREMLDMVLSGDTYSVAELQEFGLYFKTIDDKLAKYLKDTYNNKQFKEIKGMTALSVAMIHQDVAVIDAILSKANDSYITQSIYFDASSRSERSNNKNVYHLIAYNDYTCGPMKIDPFVNILFALDSEMPHALVTMDKSKQYLPLNPEKYGEKKKLYCPIQMAKAFRDFRFKVQDFVDEKGRLPKAFIDQEFCNINGIAVNVGRVVSRRRMKRYKEEQEADSGGSFGSSPAKTPKYIPKTLRPVYEGTFEFESRGAFAHSSGIINLNRNVENGLVLKCIEVMLIAGSTDANWKSGIRLEFENGKPQSFGCLSSLQTKEKATAEIEEKSTVEKTSRRRLPLNTKKGECITLVRAKFQRQMVTSLYFYTNIGYGCGVGIKENDDIWVCGDELVGMQFWYTDDKITGINVIFVEESRSIPIDISESDKFISAPTEIFAVASCSEMSD